MLRDINSLKGFIKPAEGKYRGSNNFMWKEDRYIACVKYDLTKEIPEYFYSEFRSVTDQQGDFLLSKRPESAGGTSGKIYAYLI